MKSSKLALALSVVNSMLVLVLLAQSFASARAEDNPPVLRGRGLQIVDEQGRVRASISVLPAGRSERGPYSETVLLRLITEQVAGLSVAGTSGTKDTYAILEARGETSTLRIRSENGKEYEVKP